MIDTPMISKIDGKYESLIQCIKLSKKEQKKLLNWLGKQNVLVQIDIMSEQKNQFFKLKNQCKSTDIVALSALFIAIDYYYSLQFSGNKKSRKGNLEDNKKVSDFLIKQAQTEALSPKQEKILDYKSIILNLKAQGFGSRKISAYLLNKHKFNVSHDYICKNWELIKNGN